MKKQKKEHFDIKIVIRNVETFKKIITSMNTLFEEGLFNFTPDNLNSTPMNISCNVICNMVLDSSFFESYYVKNSTTMGISIKNLALVIKALKADVIELSQTEENKDILIINSTNKSGSSAEIKLKLMELDMQELQKPEVKYTFEHDFDIGTITDLIKSVEAFDDTIFFVVKGKYLSAYANGDIGSKTETIEWTDESDIHVDRLAFSTKFLTSVIDAGKIVKKVKLSMDAEYPISFIYQLDEKSSLNFFIGPKMIDELDN